MRKRKGIPATEVRVHLGEALKAVEEEDLVIEKGGVPVAILTKYVPAGEASMAVATEYERAVSKRAEPGGIERMTAAMARGWAAIDADEFIEDVYRAREEGASNREVTLDGDEGEADEGELPDRHGRVYRRPPAPDLRVADGPGPEYRV
ncbi:MAG: hypothetical protein KGK07_10720 [Chloroflexota bacterium]|nr:hypothetical protein [Chloroflexota bacterium]